MSQFLKLSAIRSIRFCDKLSGLGPVTPTRHHQVVAHRTVVRNRDACLAGVIPVVAAKASGRICVAYVVRVRFPTNVHRGKHIVSIDFHQGIG
jgi:hypothetical protein